jgi:hypothetical protein
VITAQQEADPEDGAIVVRQLERAFAWLGMVPSGSLIGVRPFIGRRSVRLTLFRDLGYSWVGLTSAGSAVAGLSLASISVVRIQRRIGRC